MLSRFLSYRLNQIKSNLTHCFNCSEKKRKRRSDYDECQLSELLELQPKQEDNLKKLKEKLEAKELLMLVKS